MIVNVDQVSDQNQTLWIGSRWIFGLDSEFDSIHFGIEINKCLKFFRTKKFFGPKD